MTSTMPLPLVLRAVSFTPFASYMDFRFDVMSGTFSSLTLEASNNMSTWSNEIGRASCRERV